MLAAILLLCYCYWCSLQIESQRHLCEWTRVERQGIWLAGSCVLVSYALWEWVCFFVDPLFKRIFNAYECFALVCITCMPGTHGDQKRATHSITGITDVYKLPCASWDSNLGLLKEAFLTPELSPQPLPGDLLFKKLKYLEIFLLQKDYKNKLQVL